MWISFESNRWISIEQLQEQSILENKAHLEAKQGEWKVRHMSSAMIKESQDSRILCQDWVQATLKSPEPD